MQQTVWTDANASAAKNVKAGTTLQLPAGDYGPLGPMVSPLYS